MSTIGIIDYGMGNLHSLHKAMVRVACDDRVTITYDPDKLMRCDRIVLPGVGGARYCMEELNRLELADFVRLVAGKKPMLGVCLGMQIMLDRSLENGCVDTLGLFPGTVEKFPDPATAASGKNRVKVPQMGWNTVKTTREHPIFAGIPDNSWFYFVHSYRVVPEDKDHMLGVTEHGIDFCSVLLRENLVATQFHPEKSQAAGMQLLTNFVDWDGEA